MRLRGKVLRYGIALALAGTTGCCVEGFRGQSFLKIPYSCIRDSKTARRRAGTRRLRNITPAVLKIGAGLLGLGSATVYLCSMLTDGSGNQQPAAMLKYTTDFYDGVTIDETTLPKSVDEFKSVIETSLEQWRLAGKKGVWLKVPVERAELVEISLKMGFELHHAERAYIMFNKWLPGTVNQLPPNASHQIGVGAFVLNHEGEVLVVMEKNGPLRGTGVWKFPTGLVDSGEDIPDAAAREVMEETGVDAEFDSILAFRHSHSGLFGKGDLFFVVRMTLKEGTDASKLRPQASEIEACQWMPKNEFADQALVQGTPLLRELSRIMQDHVSSDLSVSDINGDEEDRDGEEEDGARKRTAASFIGKPLESGRKSGGMSMLYYGKL